MEKNPASASYMDGLLRRVPAYRERISQFVRLADLGIAETQLVPAKRDPVRKRATVQALHRVLEAVEYGELPFGDSRHAVYEVGRKGGERKVTLELSHHSAVGAAPLPYKEESLGTQTWIALVAHALEALDAGGSLLVDELDASLHPLLMGEILRLFADEETNPHGAQLIFTTHDTTTLGTMTGIQPLSRGQIWFAEKDREGSSRLTPLTDYRPRKGENIERGYLQGRYGGTPQIRSFEAVPFGEIPS